MTTSYGYQESAGTVTLTVTRQDYEAILFALGTAVGCAVRDGLPIAVWLEVANRISAGNPAFLPYEIPENPQASTK